MATNRTFTMIKPHAVAANNIGGITAMIEAAGFRIVAMKKTQLSAAQFAIKTSFFVNFVKFTCLCCR